MYLGTIYLSTNFARLDLKYGRQVAILGEKNKALVLLLNLWLDQLQIFIMV
jgi:hypothetical protein